MNKLLLAIGLLMSLGLAGWTGYVQAKRTGPAVPAWEYQEVEFTMENIANAKLNSYGAQGWELVAVTSACESADHCRSKAYFKRSR